MPSLGMRDRWTRGFYEETGHRCRVLDGSRNPLIQTDEGRGSHRAPAPPPPEKKGRRASSPWERLRELQGLR